MRDYARTEEDLLVEFLSLEDNQEIYELFPPTLTWVEITGMSPVPGYGWSWDGVKFNEPPPPYVDPRPPILYELEQIDKASARPLRVMIIADPNAGVGTPERAELEALELRAADLRAQLDALPPHP